MSRAEFFFSTLEQCIKLRFGGTEFVQRSLQWLESTLEVAFLYGVSQFACVNFDFGEEQSGVLRHEAFLSNRPDTGSLIANKPFPF